MADAGQEVSQKLGASHSPDDPPSRDDRVVAALASANAALATLNETMRREELEEAKERDRKTVRFAEMGQEFDNLMAWYESRKQVYYAQYSDSVRKAWKQWSAKEEHANVQKAKRLEQMSDIEREITMLQRQL